MASDLREAVARAIYDAWNISGVPYDSPTVKGNVFREGKVLTQADAAIAAVLGHLTAAAEQGDLGVFPYIRGVHESEPLDDWLRSFREAGQ